MMEGGGSIIDERQWETVALRVNNGLSSQSAVSLSSPQQEGRSELVMNIQFN